MNKFLAVLAVSLLTATSAQAAEFADIDTDGDGLISVEEATAAMPDVTEDAFAAADKDADGNLNADEYAAMSD
jgi:Ca2+-binding EF-hand superfamily protein